MKRLRRQVRNILNNAARPLRAVPRWVRKATDPCYRARRFEVARDNARVRARKQRERGNRRRANFWRDAAVRWGERMRANRERCQAQQGRRVVSRSEWGARPPKSRDPLSSDRAGVFIHYTVGGTPQNLEEGKREMRAIQNFHMDSRGWNDFAYSYAVDQAGNVYEGRGRGVAGAHTEGYNCLDAGERVLAADLTWKPGGDLKPGDLIWAFDEFPREDESYRQWRAAHVVANEPREEECWIVELADGNQIITTGAHPWLNARGQRRSAQWLRTEKLAALLVGDFRAPMVSKPLYPWKRLDTYDAGWLAGLLDGEGCIHRGRVSLAQKPGPIMDRAQHILDDLGFSYYINERGNRSTWDLGLTGGRAASLALLGTVGATRLIDNVWGAPSAAMKNGRGLGDSQVEVVDVRPAGKREIAVLGTSTGTFIGEGFAMHNSTSHAICGMLNASDRPTDAMVAAMRWVRRDVLDAGSKLLRGHSEVASTSCPGDGLRARLSDL